MVTRPWHVSGARQQRLFLSCLLPQQNCAPPHFFPASEEQHGLVEGVTICFFDSKDQTDEPMLIVGQVQYHVEQGTAVKNVSNEWGLWYAFFSWSMTRKLDEVFSPVPKDTDRIEWMKVIAVPLYDIQSMKCVETLMERVRGRTSSEDEGLDVSSVVANDQGG